MLIKFPGELKTGDIIVIDNDRYIFEKYIQGNCIGSFIWGASGRLDCYPFSTHNLENLQKSGGWPLNKTGKNFMTYENYPFVVLEKDDIGTY